jgi:hypothetical protein
LFYIEAQDYTYLRKAYELQADKIDEEKCKMLIQAFTGATLLLIPIVGVVHSFIAELADLDIKEEYHGSLDRLQRG